MFLNESFMRCFGSCRADFFRGIDVGVPGGLHVYI